MSVNPEALQKLLMEMDNQLNKSRAELSMCNLQLERVDSNINLIKQTSTSLNSLCDVKAGEVVWQGIGKAFVSCDVNSYLTSIDKDEKEFLETKSGLEKKKVYLETTLEKTIDGMSKIVGPPQN
ncbi:uncharacterized protein PRCAT00000062001 [Priceomyces carsonii]|uniref:uncharacterized protein n=1 Tax=Priceomyces carsonii TaxID=28549 RepID=UPI002ED7C35A|nr:unnamed protein product [Priceomyces carsonii]